MIRSALAYWVLPCCLAGCQAAPAPDTAADPFAALAVSQIRDIAIPSNHRNWKRDLAVLPVAVRRGNQVEIRNVRDFRYQSDQDYIVRYSDKSLDLRDVRTVDFIVVPFKSTPTLAHTMLSFGFADGSQLGVSAEARLEEGEEYSPWKGALRQYELMYVLAEERDLIGRRTRFRDADVYLYPTVASAEQSQAIFVDVLDRVNQLAAQPEFYDTLRNNCTTNIVRHVNRLKPGTVVDHIRLLLPGFSDQYAFELGLLRTDQPFAEARHEAHVSALANRYLTAPDFSQKIRRR